MALQPVPGTPAWLREINDRTALTLLLEHGSLTRNRIGELSGLSKPTASQMVSRLESAGLITAAGEVSGGRGPNAASYAVRSDRVRGVAIDIEAHVMRSCVVDALGNLYPTAVTSLVRTARKRSAETDVRSAIEAACAVSGTSIASIQQLCIGVPGALDARRDELTFVETLPGWPRKGIQRHLEDRLGLSVRIDNDANLAAIAERAAGAGTDVSGFALLWMGVGLGLAVDQGGTVHRGASGGAGEIGYLPVPAAASALDSDAVDLQDLIGGTAVTQVGRAHGLHGRGYAGIIDALRTAPYRQAAVTELAPRVGAAVIPVLALLDPELIVLGGPTGRAGGDLLADLVTAHVAKTSRWSPAVAVSRSSDPPVLSGAGHVLVATIRDELFSSVSRLPG